MHRLSNITISMQTVVTLAAVIFISLALISFVLNVFGGYIKPFFLTKSAAHSGLTITTSLDAGVEYLRTRGDKPAARLPDGQGGLDLTAVSSSATLTNETKYTAEVINGSGIAGAARTLADGLETLGISTSQVGNTEAQVANTVIALKANSEILRGSIVEKIGTKSAELRFEKLEESYPFDIRIVIGR